MFFVVRIYGVHTFEIKQILFKTQNKGEIWFFFFFKKLYHLNAISDSSLFYYSDIHRFFKQKKKKNISVIVGSRNFNIKFKEFGKKMDLRAFKPLFLPMHKLSFCKVLSDKIGIFLHVS